MKSVAAFITAILVAPATASADQTQACFDAARAYLSPEYRHDRTPIKSGFTSFSRVALSEPRAPDTTQCVNFTVEGSYIHRPASVPECEAASAQASSFQSIRQSREALERRLSCLAFQSPLFRHYTDSMVWVRRSENLDPSLSTQIIEARGAILCRFHSPESALPHSIEFVNPETCN